MSIDDTQYTVGHVQTPVHGRYLIHQPDSLWAAEINAGESPPLVVGFHGYKESAEHQLNRLKKLPSASRYLCCSVQALHPFYTSAGGIVSSWMTRLDRNFAIRNNMEYVRRVVGAVRREHSVGGGLAFMGFSQGACMAYRAAWAMLEDCSAIVAVAGDLPDEFSTRPTDNHPPVLICRGSADKYYSAENLEKDRKALESRGVVVEVCEFNGGHEWTPELYEAVDAFVFKHAITT